VADTPTPTAQDWGRLGAIRGFIYGGWDIWDPAAPKQENATVIGAGLLRGSNGWWVGLRHKREVEDLLDGGTEADAFTICAALVLLASGVLTTGADQ
jgi:hypothetical protein